MDTTAISIAGLVFGLIAFLLVIAYVVVTHIVLPNSATGTLTFANGLSYAVVVGLGVVGIVNIAYTSLNATGKTSPSTNVALIATTMTLLAIINIVLGYAEYSVMGTNMADRAQYFQMLLPANLLISVVATSLILMQKLSSV